MKNSNNDAKRRQFLEKRAEKERIQAKKRLEDAKVREEKKMQQEQLNAAKKQAKNRRAEVLKEQSEQKKRAKKERQKMIKKETPAQKSVRVKEEREEKLKMRAARKEAAHMQKQQRASAARIRREERAKQPKGSKRYAGWLTATVVLSVSVLALGTTTSLLLIDKRDSDIAISNTYEKSYNDFVGYVDNMDVNLSKLRVSNSGAEQQKLLSNVFLQAELAESNVQQLPINDESKINTAGFINSAGDYARSLSNKLSKGGKISLEERENLEKLYQINRSLKEQLGEMSEQMGHKYNFKSLRKGKESDLIISGFDEMENHSMEYPKLIYDGPFSAGLEDLEARALKGLEEISAQTAAEKVREYFKDYGIKDLSYTGDADGQGFSVYNFDVTLPGGSKLFAQISKQGGKLIMFNMLATCKTTNFDQDICIGIAENFLQSIGIDGMKAVWINDNASLATINFVYESCGTIVYPDMIKIKVCEETGKVLGLEARAYYLNHTGDRSGHAAISIDAARANVSNNIDIQSERLAIIPKEGGGEITAYEFMGTFDDTTYYVYIDAATGQETEVFKVVKSTEGILLI